MVTTARDILARTLGGHVTRRQGRPYTLVLTKTDAVFTGDLRSRAGAAADLEWLAAEWHRAV